LANLWIDGKKVVDPSNANAPDQGELKFLSTREIAMIEVYPRMFDTPIHYVNRGADMGMCGTILI